MILIISFWQDISVLLSHFDVTNIYKFPLIVSQCILISMAMKLLVQLLMYIALYLNIYLAIFFAKKNKGSLKLDAYCSLLIKQEFWFRLTSTGRTIQFWPRLRLLHTLSSRYLLTLFGHSDNFFKYL